MWAGLRVRSPLLVGPELAPPTSTGGEGIGSCETQTQRPRIRRPQCAKESLPLLLNTPLFLCGLVSDTKCNSRWGGT